MGQGEIDDSRGILVSRSLKAELHRMESARFRLTLTRCAPVAHSPAAATMPAELSCLHRTHPLACDRLTKQIHRPFALPSLLGLRGQAKGALPVLSLAFTKERKLKNKKEKHHLTHQIH